MPPLQLSGLPTAEGREIFQARGDFWALEDEWRVLVEHYAGNPLALEMVAPAIQDLFDNNVSKFLEFLKQNTFVFDNIRNLLERQFNRLSGLEKEVMYWLGINREPITFPELREDFILNVRSSEILEALASLQRRALVEKTSNGFTQQPVVMEYITEQLIERVCAEIIEAGTQDLLLQETGIFRSHALMKATAKDYIRETQTRLILQLIIDRLLRSYQLGFVSCL